MDADGYYGTYPWIVLNGRMEAWLDHDHCYDNRNSGGPQLYASVGYSLDLIKEYSGL